LHTIERQAEQLRAAGICSVPSPNLSALKFGHSDDFSRFGLFGSYAILIPSGSASRPYKRWPPDSFIALARILSKQKITPVFLGTESERNFIETIASECQGARNLAGETSLLDLFSLSFGAKVAVGNDTGPMHIMASTGCSSVILFSNDSDPLLCGQRGPSVTILRRDKLLDIGVPEVVKALAL
jgi:ADP-heptose:LPS heptosyltransferase